MDLTYQSTTYLLAKHLAHVRIDYHSHLTYICIHILYLTYLMIHAVLLVLNNYVEALHSFPYLRNILLPELNIILSLTRLYHTCQILVSFIRKTPFKTITFRILV
jgi:hypothetical protein